MVTAPNQELTEVSMEQVLKWDSGNDLWAAMLLEPSDKTSSLTEQHLLNGVPSQIKDLIYEIESIFHTPSSLPPARPYDHAINILPNVVPINCKPYRYSSEHKNEIERQVETMLKSGIVIPCLSPYAYPVLLVKKKDNTWRFCVNYRKLNSITIKNKFPLPIIDEFLDEIAGVKYFSTIDLASGLHQIRMQPKDESKIDLKTHHGHFQFRVMPFGLTNALATF
jgi:hypothetical protein